MQPEQNSIGIEFDLEKAGFELITPANSRVQIVFPDAPPNHSIAVMNNAYSLRVTDALTASVYSEYGMACVTFAREGLSPGSVRMGVSHCTVETIDETTLFLQSEVEKIYVDLIGITIESIADNVLSLIYLTSEPRMRFRTDDAGDVNTLSVGMMSHGGTGGSLLVALGKRAPTFVVGVYDDISRLRPRPLRLGIPVISTVPVDGSSVTAEEQIYIDLGEGPENRKMFFRVICDQELDPKYAVVLRIQLPDVLGMTSDAINMPLVWVSTSSGQTVYEAEYVFHREDAVKYVDGYAYLSVYVDLDVQVSLPLRIQVGNSTYTSDPPEDPSVFSSSRARPALLLPSSFSVIEESKPIPIPIQEKRKRTRNKNVTH